MGTLARRTRKLLIPLSSKGNGNARKFGMLVAIGSGVKKLDKQNSIQGSHSHVDPKEIFDQRIEDHQES
jgi:hypothetical protein